MSSMFCCSSIVPYRGSLLMHESKFQRFMTWAQRSKSSPVANSALQLVQQINYGPVESKRYFIPSTNDSTDGNCGFLEVTEQDLIIGNFQKLNTYKNFKCTTHNKFFELNIYQKNPINKHHWRFNIARPSTDIDI
ncbi:hypothetical protein N7470_006800 [Penicillium chermesinum]|nr:hypothetical protein N7470_006800 [Penicillium chermesinum]